MGLAWLIAARSQIVPAAPGARPNFGFAAVEDMHAAARQGQTSERPPKPALAVEQRNAGKDARPFHNPEPNRLRAARKGDPELAADGGGKGFHAPPVAPPNSLVSRAVTPKKSNRYFTFSVTIMPAVIQARVFNQSGITNSPIFRRSLVNR